MDGGCGGLYDVWGKLSHLIFLLHSEKPIGHKSRLISSSLLLTDSKAPFTFYGREQETLALSKCLANLTDVAVGMQYVLFMKGQRVLT